jgi:hypothetical protein
MKKFENNFVHSIILSFQLSCHLTILPDFIYTDTTRDRLTELTSICSAVTQLKWLWCAASPSRRLAETGRSAHIKGGVAVNVTKLET